MIFPSASASRRTASCGASGLIFTTSARRHTAISRRSCAACSAPTTCEMRPYAPGNRAAPSRWIVCQTLWRISAFVIASRRACTHHAVHAPFATTGFLRSQFRIPREPPREDQKAGVCDHAVRGTDAAVADVPETGQRLERLDRPEASGAQRVDQLLHLQRGWQEGGDDAAGPERPGHRVEQAPGLGEID